MTRTQAEMITHNPEAYTVDQVRVAACWMLGYLDLSDTQVADYAALCTYQRNDVPAA